MPPVFFILLLCFLVYSPIASAQPSFDLLPDHISYGHPSDLNDVFDISPDAKFAAVFASNAAGGKIIILDPLTGVRLDEKGISTYPIGIKFVSLGDEIRVVTFSNYFGDKFITIFDVDPEGRLAQRSSVQINNDPGISIEGSNIVYSPRLRAGFVCLSANRRLISFSLDTGSVLQTLVTPVSKNLSLYEDASRTLLVGGVDQELIFINYSDPSNMKELGRVELPSTGEAFGTLELAPVFSVDGNYVFAGNGFSRLSAIHTTSRQVIGSLNNDRYRTNRLKSFESSGSRLLVMKGVENGNNAIKGLALVNATDPTNLNVISEIEASDSSFTGSFDFSISADGHRLLVTSFRKLSIYRVPDSALMAETLLTGVTEAVKVISFGGRDRILAAWWNRLYSIPNRTNVLSNFDIDLRTDVSTFRPSKGTWQWLRSSDGMPGSPVPFGEQGDLVVPGDYDGDGITDPAIYRHLSHKWRILESRSGTIREVVFGLASDLPVPADYDGDGKTDLAFFRRNPNRWLVLASSDGSLIIRRARFGKSIPVTGDYDGDGKADFVTFRDGAWNMLMADGSTNTVSFGQTGDLPIAGDFDNDGKSDIALFSSNTGTWKIQGSLFGYKEHILGQPSDVPVPGDYDGDGKADVAVYQITNSTWRILQSSNDTIRTVQFGMTGDVPLARQ